jgi:hypothetical protein
MKEQYLWDVVTNGILAPAPAQAQTAEQSAQQVQPVVDPTVQAVLEKKDIEAQRVIFEVVKDHLIPHVSEKANSKEMYDAVVSLFQSDNMS